VLICRVQLPEDTALGQVAAPPPQASNPPAAVTTTSQNSATTTPETPPPAVGGGAGAIGPQRPGFVVYLMEHVWNDPHLRICEPWLPSPTAFGIFLTTRQGSLYRSSLPWSINSLCCSPYRFWRRLLRILCSGFLRSYVPP
jgi:hypothetical protein